MLLLFSFIAYVSAFVPQGRILNSLKLNMAGEEMIGASREVNNGEVYDPLDLFKLHDVAPTVFPHAQWLREAELKHGRVAMLATIGVLVTQCGIHLPSPNGMFDTTNIIDAPLKAGVSPMLQIIAGVGFLESMNHGGKMSVSDMFENTDREPGTFTNPIYGAFRLKSMKQEDINELKLKELKNGRLAMFAISGMIHHQIIAGTETFGDFAAFNPFAK
jgi:hypothetical protein